MRIAILAHEKFPDRAKTALGVLRYGDHDVAAVLDRDTAGKRVSDFVSDVQDAPIVAELADLEDEADELDALLIGISPIGGEFDESWRDDVRTALEYGCDVVSGLHYFLAEDEEFARLAEENGCELRDVRNPPEDLTVADGVAGEVDAEVILTVGTDCSVGKMTTTMELARDARQAGFDAAVIPTGQTGIMIEGWGNPIDRVVSDFTAGAVEEMITELGDEYDYLFVEGQGSIVHPAYSPVTLGILHGSMADKLVLCHEAGREAIHGYESFSLPSIPTYVDLYESIAEPVAEGRVVAGALNTAGLDDDAARQAVDEYAETLGAPATDVIRFDTDDVLEALR
ncbi:DUF1611 domain-containing protein [Natrinema salifodinae]|uniref:Uncharacterized conserved protein, NAD-dependent epimerase/dehydratase family n=1 Tax=Natrinema salifodinae TaxID=1202768 RepID=A0A1I0NLK1_9EURY|nr:DUF1611 domain-containing protein [Natrinema salifodinae]SEW02321.1 Uncharacterized conserved protein, NAD-dependent epimerase/dehydratase family [Natrinema salifodinae]